VIVPVLNGHQRGDSQQANSYGHEGSWLGSYVLSQKLGMGFEVSKLPFAVLIGADGTLQSKGLVNTREHLESLIEAMDTGIATLQEYVGIAQQELDHSVKEKAS
jgi:methylamine dehydrogenase accessory protein MauD